MPTDLTTAPPPSGTASDSAGAALQPPGTWGSLLPAIVGADLTEDGTVIDGGPVFPFHVGFSPDRKHLIIRRHDGEAGFAVPHPITEDFISGAFRSAGVSYDGDLSGLTADVRRAFGLSRTFKKVSTVIPHRVSFLWKPYVPRRALTLLGGDGGMAKSMAVTKLAAHISTGQTLPGGWRPMDGEPSSVLLLSAEDDGEDVITPRLMAVGADLDRVTIRGFNLNDDLYLDDSGLEVIEWQAKDIRPRLIVVDPVVSFMGENIDMHRSNEVRPILRRLGALAVKLDSAVLAVAHFNKDEAKKAGNRLAGTADFRNGARSLLLAGRLDGEPERGRAIFHNKANYAKEGPPVGYEVEEASVEVKDGAAEVGRVAWRDTDLTEPEVFGGKYKDRPKGEVVREIARVYLSQQPDRRADSKDVKAVIRAAFPEVSTGTISNATGPQGLGVVVHRSPEGPTDWELPASEAVEDAAGRLSERLFGASASPSPDGR
jgi:hypothetical protein